MLACFDGSQFVMATKCNGQHWVMRIRSFKMGENLQQNLGLAFNLPEVGACQSFLVNKY